MRCLLHWLALLAALIAAPAMAQQTHIRAELIVEKAALPGETVTLAFLMKPDKTWHGYWQNPGDAGLGMRFAWALPPGFTPGAPRYPVPETLIISGLMNHVYEHDYAVLVPLTVPANATAGQTIPLKVKAEWLACTDQICVPERAELSASLTIGQGKGDPRFDQWRAALPAPLGSEGRFEIAGKTVRIGVPLPASVKLENPHFFIGEDRIAAYADAQEFRRKGDLLIVTLQRAKFAPIEPVALSGVLRLNEAGDGVELKAVPGAVPQGGDVVRSSTDAPPLSFPMLLLAALAGGLLLNVMPCVFPILSLKALSLARAGESAKEARAEGWAYTAGVVLACAALGALLLALRAAGEQVGWAFQLQEPAVVVALLLLATAITANLAGLYELTLPGLSRAGSPQGAFGTGLLAAFAATPCTGPFMAAAMGAALLLPTAQGMALFVALGLGLALPFLAIAEIPALRKLLPRPGAWMNWFRKLMAVPMGLTALALLWLCWRLGGDLFAALVAAAGLALTVILFATGREQKKGHAARKYLLLFGGPLLALTAATLPQVYQPRVAGAVESILDAQPFSEEALAKARASGKPVFVYFTADWCLTCKVNENAAIEREETKAAFDKAGVQVLVGDWTRRDPAITRFLTAHGAAGVPLYLWYAPGKDAEQLPQVLSVSELAGKALR